MIVQIILNFLRDTFVNWLGGTASIFNGVDLSGAGAAVGGVAAQAAHLLSLFIAPGVWPVVFSTWGVFLAVWGTTALIAILARRGSSE